MIPLFIAQKVSKVPDALDSQFHIMSAPIQLPGFSNAAPCAAKLALLHGPLRVAVEVVRRILDFAFVPRFDITSSGATNNHSLLDIAKSQVLKLSSALSSLMLPTGLLWREVHDSPPESDPEGDYSVCEDGSFAVTTDKHFVLVKDITVASRCTVAARSELWCIAWASQSRSNSARFRARVVLWTICSGIRRSGRVSRAAHYFSPSAAPELELIWTQGQSVEVHGPILQQMRGYGDWIGRMDDLFGDVVVSELEAGLSELRFGRTPQTWKRTFQQDQGVSGKEGVLAEVLGVLP